MATKTNCSTSVPETPVCKFYKKIATEKNRYEEEGIISSIKIASLNIERAYATCSLAKAEETFKYYRNLNNFELINLKDSAEIIENEIKSNVQKDTELSKMITGASKQLSELKIKLHDANNAACTMRNCLQSHLGLTDLEVQETDVLVNVATMAKNLSRNGKKAADAMVHVAGIHTFSNIETLQPFATNLKAELTELKSLTDSSISDANTAEDVAQGELVEVIKKLNKEKFEAFHTTNKVKGIKDTLQFICEGKCEPIECVDEICMKLGCKELDQPEPEKVEFSTDSYTKGDKD